jgi:hypothetical protein
MGKRITLLVSLFFVLAVGSAFADSGPAQQGQGPFAQAVHAVGNITYKDASQQSWNWDRGKITALSSSSISITRRDNVVVTLAITSSTLVRNDGGSYGLSDLQIGLAATVISQNGNADIIRDIRGDGAPSGADQSAIDGPAKGSVTGTIQAQYTDGSTQSLDYNRGRITQLGNGSLTIKRADGQTLTFTYDGTTVVREQGQLESTDDLQVGEGAMFFSQNGALELVRCLAPAGAQQDPPTSPSGA